MVSSRGPKNSTPPATQEQSSFVIHQRHSEAFRVYSRYSYGETYISDRSVTIV